MATQLTSQVAQRPTNVRRLVIVFAVALAVVTYIDRVCISFAAPLITRDLRLTSEQMGWAFTAFGWAYALFEIPGGYLGDRIGPRSVLMRIVLWWSFFTAATGWAWNAGSLAVTRFLFGMGEAGCFPNLTKMFTTWLPERERVKAQGTTWLSARWGGAFTPPLVALVIFGSTWLVDSLKASKYTASWAPWVKDTAAWWAGIFNSNPVTRPIGTLIAEGAGWRHGFEIFGALGVIWAICFYRWYRNNPLDNPKLNAAERELVREASKNATGHGDVPWGVFLQSRQVWMICLQYFCLSYGWYFYVTWMPTYFNQARHIDLKAVAFFSILPLFMGGIGNPVSVLLQKRLAPMIGSVAQTRRVMAYIGFTGAAAFLIYSTRLNDPVMATFAIGLASFSNDLVMPGAWATCMTVGGKHAGSLSGAMNMSGNIGGAISPLAIGYILKWTDQNWNLTFYISAAIYLCGIICWKFLDSTTPLPEHDETPIPRWAKLIGATLAGGVVGGLVGYFSGISVPPLADWTCPAVGGLAGLAVGLLRNPHRNK